MNQSPINPRADVSPTCRGSTGFIHNGWNPTPLVPSDVWFEFAAIEQGLNLLSNRPSDQTSTRGTTTEGVRFGGFTLPESGHAGVPHDALRSGSTGSHPPRPRRRLRYGTSTGFQRPARPLLSTPRRSPRRLRRGRLGIFKRVLPAPASIDLGQGPTQRPASPRLRRGARLRLGPAGRGSAGGGPVAVSAVVGARVGPGLLLRHRGGDRPATGRFDPPPESGGVRRNSSAAPGRRAQRVCPVCPRLPRAPGAPVHESGGCP